MIDPLGILAAKSGSKMPTAPAFSGGPPVNANMNPTMPFYGPNGSFNANGTSFPQTMLNPSMLPNLQSSRLFNNLTPGQLQNIMSMMAPPPAMPTGTGTTPPPAPPPMGGPIGAPIPPPMLPPNGSGGMGGGIQNILQMLMGGGGGMPGPGQIRL